LRGTNGGYVEFAPDAGKVFGRCPQCDFSLGLLVEQLQGNLSVENARFNICQYPLLGERINTGSSSSQCFNKIL